MVRQLASAITLGVVALNIASGMALPVFDGMDNTWAVISKREIDMTSDFSNIDARDMKLPWDNDIVVRRGFGFLGSIARAGGKILGGVVKAVTGESDPPAAPTPPPAAPTPPPPPTTTSPPPATTNFIAPMISQVVQKVSDLAHETQTHTPTPTSQSSDSSPKDSSHEPTNHHSDSNRDSSPGDQSGSRHNSRPGGHSKEEGEEVQRGDRDPEREGERGSGGDGATGRSRFTGNDEGGEFAKRNELGIDKLD